MNDLSKYNAIKDSLKSGDLILWQTNNFVGNAIQLFTGSIYSHASIVLRLSEYEGLERRRFTTEALRYGVVLNLLSRRLEHQNGVAWVFPLKDDWDLKRQAIGEKALSLVGIPYDYGSLWKMISGEVFADALKLFCSEYCFLAYGFEGQAPTPGEMPSLGIFKKGVKLI